MSHISWNSKGYEKFDEQRAGEYAAIANEVFAPIYPVIAGQILERCGVKNGLCIDVGCGPANLSLALAKLTSLSFCAMDFAPHILDFAQANIDREGLAARVCHRCRGCAPDAFFGWARLTDHQPWFHALLAQPPRCLPGDVAGSCAGWQRICRGRSRLVTSGGGNQSGDDQTGCGLAE